MGYGERDDDHPALRCPLQRHTGGNSHLDLLMAVHLLSSWVRRTSYRLVLGVLGRRERYGVFLGRMSMTVLNSRIRRSGVAVDHDDVSLRVLLLILHLHLHLLLLLLLLVMLL